MSNIIINTTPTIKIIYFVFQFFFSNKNRQLLTVTIIHLHKQCKILFFHYFNRIIVHKFLKILFTISSLSTCSKIIFLKIIFFINCSASLYCITENEHHTSKSNEFKFTEIQMQYLQLQISFIPIVPGDKFFNSRTTFS